MILVTGGAGFIGPHVAVELLTTGYDVVIVENLVNLNIACVEGIEQITGGRINFEAGDLCDFGFLNSIFLK